MITYENALDFIENYLNIKLFTYQKRMLKNLIDGKITNMPRCTGTSLVINSYAKYLDHKHYNCKLTGDYDDYITYEEIQKSTSKERGKRPPISYDDGIDKCIKEDIEAAIREYNITNIKEE